MEEEEENQTKVTEDIFKNITVGNLRDIKLKMPFFNFMFKKHTEYQI